MKATTLFRACAAAAFFLTSGFALAQGNSQGHGHGRGHDKGRHGDDQEYGNFYGDHDRAEMHEWYREHYRHLPPGLAKRDQLPPGLERQLVVRGTLPPGLRREIEPVPPELVRELPPPPPDCEHVVIGGHIVLLNRRNFTVVDVFHFELN
jgi:hypothetical protein